MAITVIDSSQISGALLHINTDVDETEDDVDSGAGTLYAIEVDKTPFEGGGLADRFQCMLTSDQVAELLTIPG